MIKTMHYSACFLCNTSQTKTYYPSTKFLTFECGTCDTQWVWENPDFMKPQVKQFNGEPFSRLVMGNTDDTSHTMWI